jgi:hypothetical protein
MIRSATLLSLALACSPSKAERELGLNDTFAAYPRCIVKTDEQRARRLELASQCTLGGNSPSECGELADRLTCQTELWFFVRGNLARGAPCTEATDPEAIEVCNMKGGAGP